MALGTGAQSFLNSIKSIFDKFKEDISKKQDKVTGTAGQVAGFDADGNLTAQTAPETGVTSFKGRTGNVTPASGDYTAEQVGAIPTTGGKVTGTIDYDVPETTEDALLKVGGVSSIVEAKSDNTDLILGRFDGKANMWFEEYDGVSDEDEAYRVGLWGVATPKADSFAANKKYVDDTVSSATSNKLPLAGGLMTGAIQSMVTTSAQSAIANIAIMGRSQKTYSAIKFQRSAAQGTNGYDGITFLTGSSASLPSPTYPSRVMGVDTPVNDTDAPNKKYVDDKAAGYLPLTGGTITGVVTSAIGSGTATIMTDTTTSDKDVFVGLLSNGATGIGFINSSSLLPSGRYVKIKGVKDPTGDDEAANKAYVDSKAYNAPAYVSGGITFISTNEGIKSSYSSMVWKTKVAVTVTCTCRCYAEASYDYLTVRYTSVEGASSNLVNQLASGTDATISQAMSVGDELTFEYRKDTSQDKNEDCAKISNITVGGVAVKSVGALQHYFNMSTPSSDSPFAVLIEASGSSGKVSLTSGVSGVLPAANGGTGNGSGIAPYATQLYTSRSITTNLGSTTAASFNGTADVTPGITGTLGIGNGGTGKTTAPLGLYNLINNTDTIALSSTGIATSDYIPVADVSASTGKKITLANLKTALGISSSSGLSIAIGTYTGARGASTTTAQAVSVSFQPKVVFVYRSGNISDYVDFSGKVYEKNWALAANGYPFYGSSSVAVLTVTSTGFSVANATSSGVEYMLNYQNYTYCYIAIG